MTATPDLDPTRLGAFLRGLALRFDEVSPTRVTGTIQATADHQTPWGITHGGVYTAAIESACSVGASAAVQDKGQFAVGLSNQTDFLRSHREGPLALVAEPVYQGATAQLWQCTITRADGKLVARGQLRLQNVDPR